MQRRSVLVAAGLVVFVIVCVAAVRSLQRPARRPSSPRPDDVAQSETVTTAEPMPVSSGAPHPRPAESARRPSPTDEAAESPSGERPKKARRTTDQLISDLSSTDDITVHEAADALANRGAVRAIVNLVTIDITKAPRAAPSVIDALGRLAGAAEPPEKKAATDRLLALLAQERARGAPESAGNVLALDQALGDTGDPRAASALEAELLDPNVTMAAKTVIVDALVKLKQPSSVAALKTLQQSLAGVVPKDKMETSILRELTAKVERALREIPEGT